MFVGSRNRGNTGNNCIMLTPWNHWHPNHSKASPFRNFSRRPNLNINSPSQMLVFKMASYHFCKSSNQFMLNWKHACFSLINEFNSEKTPRMPPVEEYFVLLAEANIHLRRQGYHMNFLGKRLAEHSRLSKNSECLDFESELGLKGSIYSKILFLVSISDATFLGSFFGFQLSPNRLWPAATVAKSSVTGSTDNAKPGDHRSNWGPILKGWGPQDTNG